ncbi:MAG: DUF3540 domain-containing protein [Deltaproteobacteria bacterium]|nr:DUF3540 domain-containing protein [Deltaproteobacteria bacterium]
MSPKTKKVVSLMEPTESMEFGGEAVRNGRVVSVSGKKAVVEMSGVTLPAHVAFSCLVQPIPGDLVLCTRTETGAHFILGIIERPGKQDMTLSFPADATMLAQEGSLSMVSGESVTLASGDRLNCFSKQAVHKSREAVVDFDELTARGTNLQANFKTIHLISRMVNTMARQVIQKVKNYIRHTEDYDQVKAGQMTRKTDGLYSMDSKHTVMVSRKGTKIDGERIYMG